MFLCQCFSHVMNFNAVPVCLFQDNWWSAQGNSCGTWTKLDCTCIPKLYSFVQTYQVYCARSGAEFLNVQRHCTHCTPNVGPFWTAEMFALFMPKYLHQSGRLVEGSAKQQKAWQQGGWSVAQIQHHLRAGSSASRGLVALGSQLPLAHKAARTFAVSPAPQLQGLLQAARSGARQARLPVLQLA